jgi:arabinose-5-phosphate isomerase
MPKLPEACGTGVVPTTSTTMTLALGDALSVAIMEHRAFSADNFRDFHPGGKLGSQLSRVGDLMHKNDAVPLVGEKTPMSDTLLTISQKGFGVVGVLDDAGYLVGIVTDGDLRRNMSGLLDLTAGEVMTKAPHTIGTTSLAEEAVNVMNTGNITCLFVVDPDGSRKVAGILHIHDCLRAGIV